MLKIETNPSYSDEDQMYAAGYLEGALTSNLTYVFWTNLLAGYHWTDNKAPYCIAEYFRNNDKYLRTMVNKATENRAFWDYLGLVLYQFDGLSAGYNASAGAEQNMTKLELAMLIAFDDMNDVRNHYCSNGPNFANMTQQEFELYNIENSHCSSLVKVTGDFSQLFMAHSTWALYQTMNRMYKHCKPVL